MTMNLEHQTLQDIIDECVSNDTKWKDPSFPPTKNSICPQAQYDENKYAGYEWIRATKIPSLTDDEGDLRVFDEKIEPNDIRQGALCDCYFLSSLSCLAEDP